MQSVVQPAPTSRSSQLRSQRIVWRRVVWYILALILVVFTLFPFLWMISVALRPESEVYTYPPRLWPQTLTFQNFALAWTDPRMQIGHYFRNTVIYAGVQTFFQLLFSSMAAFVLARYEFRGRDTIFGVVLSTVMIPSIVALVPLYIMLKSVPLAGGNNLLGLGGMGWLNSFPGLILPGIVTGYSIFFLRQFFLSVAKDLEDAARVDGCSEIGIYWRIVLPLSRPALVALGIFSFQSAWSDFEWPLIVTSGEKVKTLQLGLASFSSLDGTEWSLLMAGAVIATVPLLLIFAFLQRFIVTGINFGVGK